jgi:hypothetical protein
LLLRNYYRRGGGEEGKEKGKRGREEERKRGREEERKRGREEERKRGREEERGILRREEGFLRSFGDISFDSSKGGKA